MLKDRELKAEINSGHIILESS